MRGLVDAVRTRWVLLCGLYFLALCSAFAFTRTIIGDESQLLLVGQAVYSGLRLYRDAWFNQMPFGAYVYGAVQQLWGPSLYLGRFTSVALSLVTFVLCVRTGRLIAGDWGARAAATLFAFNWVLASHYSAAYSPALSGLLLTASAYFLFKGDSLGCRLAALVCADLAVCTRALVFPVTLAVNVHVLLVRRDARLAVLAAALLMPVLFYLGFVHGQAEHFLFANLYANKGQLVMLPIQTPADLDRAIAMLPGFGLIVLRKLADMGLWENDLVKVLLYFPVATLAVPLVAAWLKVRASRDGMAQAPCAAWRQLLGAGAFAALSAGLLGFLVATVVLVSYLLPSGAPNYQTPGYPLVIILYIYAYQALGVLHPQVLADWKHWATAAVMVAAVAYGFPNLAYSSGVRNIEGKGLTLPLNGIREVAGFMRDRSDPGDEILTDRPWFAFEAGRPMHIGFWRTYYSYAPQWSRDMAGRYHVVSAEMLQESIRTRAPKFIIRYSNPRNESDPVTVAMRYSADPEEVLRSFEAGYERLADFSGVGKSGEGAVVYVRRGF